MYFDGHVHCRDWGENHKDTIGHVLRICEKAGIDGIIDMPNTIPAITTIELAKARIALADSCNSSVFYGIHIGLTKDPVQIQEAVKAYQELFPRVAGLKLFAGRSTGDLAVVSLEDQERVYRSLRDCNYTGALTVHCEKEDMMNKVEFDYKTPITHCWARPPEAETESIRDQVKLAFQNGFDGNLHIAHVSALASADYLAECKRNFRDSDVHRLRISSGVTPHHLFLDKSAMIEGSKNQYKVNPPLRTEVDKLGLIEHLKIGTFDVIETDHAPHAIHEKESTNPPSGIPGIDKWPKIAQRLTQMGFTQSQIDNLTFNNAIRIFGLENAVKRTDNKGDLNLQEYPYGNYL